MHFTLPSSGLSPYAGKLGSSAWIASGVVLVTGFWTGQQVQELDPGLSESWPALQASQTDEVEAPTAADTLPWLQSVQEAAAALTLYLPAVQSTPWLNPATTQLFPAGQLAQVRGVAAPTSLETFPAGQSLQALAPLWSENCPAGQLTQEERLAAAVLPENVPTGQ